MFNTAVSGGPGADPTYSTVQEYSLPLSLKERTFVVIVLVVLPFSLVASFSESIFNPATESDANQSNSNMAPSPPNAVQVNVAVRPYLYSRVMSTGPC